MECKKKKDRGGVIPEIFTPPGDVLQLDWGKIRDVIDPETGRFYRIKGMKHARRVLIKLTDQMAYSTLPEIKTLRKTLCTWRNEILQFFESGLTNGRTEGFNRVAKLIQRNAYGFRNFENYRRRLIYQTM